MRLQGLKRGERNEEVVFRVFGVGVGRSERVDDGVCLRTDGNERDERNGARSNRGRGACG